jgi:hypothetical protein
MEVEAQLEVEEPRRLGVFLLVGMLTIPTIFVWLTMRRGYAASFRQAAFIYAGTLLTVGLLGSLAR